MTPKYPHIEVPLVGSNGNAFAIMSMVSRHLRKDGVSPQEIVEYRKEAMAGNYDNLLVVTMNWVTVI